MVTASANCRDIVAFTMNPRACKAGLAPSITESPIAYRPAQIALDGMAGPVTTKLTMRARISTARRIATGYASADGIETETRNGRAREEPARPHAEAAGFEPARDVLGP